MIFFIVFMVGMGSRIKINCPRIGPVNERECLPWGVFLRGPSPYLREFRRKP